MRARLEDLLRLRYAQSSEVRQRLAAQYLRHELERMEAEGIDASDGQDRATVEARVFLFACQDLVPHLVRRYCYDPADHLMREEMALYVLERLLQDDMRRIRAFAPDKGAAFSTYLKRVIANLATDFLRRSVRRAEVVDRHLGVGLEGEPENAAGESLPVVRPERPSEPLGGDMERVVAAILAQSEGDLADPDDLHQRLRPHLRLDARERLFLKAVYFEDLSAEQAGGLPGMGLNKNQANSLHRRLLERLADAFKKAGVYGDLQSLVAELGDTLAVSVQGVLARVAPNHLILVEKTARTRCGCEFDAGKRAVSGQIGDEYGRLRKRLMAYMLDFRDDAMAGEAYLDGFDTGAKRLRLKWIERAFPVAPRYTRRVREALTASNS